MGDEMKYSEGQRNQIYEKYLRPLKLKISQILLYDTNAAADFLKKYNNLLQKTSDSELLDKITELELEIEQYEKTLGKEKTFQDKSSIIIGQVEELLYESEQFTLEDFEKEVHSLVQRYKENFSGYSLEERDLLEAKIYELQARLIFKRVNQVKDKLKYRDLDVYQNRGVLTKDNLSIELTKNEMIIFLYLLNNQNRIVSRDELMSELWNNEEYINDNALTVNISRLRTKLKDFGYSDVIETRKGQGYILL